MCSTGQHRFRALPLPGDGLGHVSGGKGWGRPLRSRESALALLSAISPARVVTLKGILISNEYCGCSTRKQESPTSRVAYHLSSNESDAQIVARSGLSISGKDLWDSSRGKY